MRTHLWTREDGLRRPAFEKLGKRFFALPLIVFKLCGYQCKERLRARSKEEPPGLKQRGMRGGYRLPKARTIKPQSGDIKKGAKLDSMLSCMGGMINA